MAHTLLSHITRMYQIHDNKSQVRQMCGFFCVNVDDDDN